jgi:hypothetical protein
MKHNFLSLFLFVIGLICSAMAVSAQEMQERSVPMKRLFLYGQLRGASNKMAEIMGNSTPGTSIPLWTYSITASKDGNNYTGKMVGRSPFFHGHRTTSVKAFLIPVKFTFPDSEVFDPTTNDGCTPTGNTILSLVQGSPIFREAPFDYAMNGVNVGNSQYIDAFERANFWSKVSATPYHTVLSNPPTVTSVQSVTVPAQFAALGSASCNTAHNLGAIDINWWDPSLVESGSGEGEAGQILANVASQGVGPNDLPIFIFNSVVMYLGSTSNCCVVGYHNAFFTGGGTGPLQTYLITDWDTTGDFGGDISTMSHEVGEWMDDPLGTNPTPAWGGVGQVSGCQNNLEVGDPLSAFPTLPFSVTLSGFTYTLQELAYFSWFYGRPSMGSGGRFSDNGTFTITAAACPPGGP